MCRKIFSENDKKLLQYLIADNNEVENKKTDKISVQKKEETWNKIRTLFNSDSKISMPRSVKELRKCWENMKFKAKTAYDQQRKSAIQTGGGPPECTKLNPIDSETVKLINPAVLDPIVTGLGEDDFDVNNENEENNIIEDNLENEFNKTQTDFNKTPMCSNINNIVIDSSPKTSKKVEVTIPSRKRKIANTKTNVFQNISSNVEIDKKVLLQQSELLSLQIAEHKNKLQLLNLKKSVYKMKNAYWKEKLMQIDPTLLESNESNDSLHS